MGHELIRNLINGEWVGAKSGRTVANINPATGESIGEVVMSGREETEAAVRAAKAAFPGWRRTSAPKRGEILARAAQILTARKEELATALTLEEGKTLHEARGEVQKGINVIEFMAGEGRRLNGETIPSELSATFCWTQREALGVVGLITPWNFPVAIPSWKVAPALICGNTIVLKPASNTPWTAQILCESYLQAGLPPGVLNVVFGPGSAVGDTLVNHPDVVALSFTGSNEVGIHLNVGAAKHLKKVQAEMGGKNPLVVLADADLDLAATATVQGAFGSTGQRCTATSRAVVEASVLEEFTALVVAKTQALVIGDGTKPGVTMGPVVDNGQMKSVLELLEVGKGEARCILGGGRLTDGDLGRGLFIAPTIFAGVKSEMRIAQEEVFGPALSILVAKDFDDALEIANHTRFGLSSSLYTNDMQRVFQFVERIETGITHVNSPTVGGEAQLPFGGMKATGVGQREMGKTALDFYTEWKTVYVDYTGTKRTTNIY
ncbi:MAG: aldehyde dehydrogenase family protein [Myxococcales bacterium]|nr:aldehyde dehydrogenase family protein [Myxococcales bacterium]